jgi:hypothetical protein
VKAGDRVVHDADIRRHVPDLAKYYGQGEIVEPTAAELEAGRVHENGPQWGDVFVAWSTGDRLWDSPTYLQVLEGDE